MTQPMKFFKRFFGSEPEEEDDDEKEKEVNPIPAEKELDLIPDGTIVFGNLIKLDGVMINLADVEFINFYTRSEYGCELYFRNKPTSDRWRIGLSSTRQLIAALAKMAASR